MLRRVSWLFAILACSTSLLLRVNYHGDEG
jgi:hypothetical protein